jgi:hypothetical protein
MKVNHNRQQPRSDPATNSECLLNAAVKWSPRFATESDFIDGVQVSVSPSTSSPSFFSNDIPSTSHYMPCQVSICLLDGASRLPQVLLLVESLESIRILKQEVTYDPA